MSALLPRADMCGATRDVRFGPIADIMCLGQQCWWKSESERFGCFGVDDECELRWILHWQVGGVGAIEDAINVGGCVTHLGEAVGSIRDQSAFASKNGTFIDCRQPVASQQRNNQIAVR